MVELSQGLTATARIGFFISRYNAYRFDSRKEDDRSIRRCLMERLNSAKNHATNVLDQANRIDNRELRNHIKQTIDAIDIFKNDSNLAETGHKRPFFSSESAASVKSLQKLIEFDATVLEKTERAVKALNELERAVAAEEKEVTKAAGNIRAAITAAHNHFSERIRFIKGFGD
ncbi:MAG: hypothetical protein CL951_11360 [Erythrobacteraceae bacterium]|nr:hypothetical protein [Erythrobacteraceae bacterium]